MGRTELRPCVLPDLLRARAAVQPERVAVSVATSGDQITYGEWEARSNALARGLIARGTNQGDRVALVFGEDYWIDYLVAYAGTHKVGAVAVPISAGYATSQIAGMLEQSRVSGACGHAPPEVPGSWWRSATADLEDGQSTWAYEVPVPSSSTAEILFTSGTTGVPKGVACSHADLLFGVVTEGDRLDAHRRELIALHAFPVGSNAGQVMVRTGMHRLAHVVVMPDFEPELCAALVAVRRPTTLNLVPAMAIMLIEWGSLSRHDVSSLTHVGLTGAACPPSVLRGLAQALPGVRIENYYGATEAGMAGTMMVYGSDRSSSVGRPTAGCAVRIVGTSGASCAAGEVGEVCLKREGSPSRTYFGDPDAAESVFRNGWTRTADLGYLDDDGYLFLTDRSADSIISGGCNVSCVEVENVLYEHPSVAEAAVFGVGHAVLGECVAAVVVLRSPATDEQLRTFARKRLAPHEVPNRLIFVDRLPRNRSGKVLKSELRRLAAETHAANAPVSPRTATEEVVASVWKAVLGRTDVGVEDNFIDVGGTSIAAVQVAGMVHQLLGVEQPAEVVYAAGNIAHFAAHHNEIVASRPPRVDVGDTVPDNVPPRLSAVVEGLAATPRADRLWALLDLGRRLPPPPTGDRLRLERVTECQVPSYVAAELDSDDRVRLHFDVAPEAPVSRALAAVLWAGLDGETASQVLDVPEGFHRASALDEVVSPARLAVLDATLVRLQRQLSRAGLGTATASENSHYAP